MYKWLKSADGFDTAMASKSNYSDGLITARDGAPAVRHGASKFDFGVGAAARACAAAHAAGAYEQSRIYTSEARGSTDTVVNWEARGSHTLRVPAESLAGAITTLEMFAAPAVREFCTDSFGLDGKSYVVHGRQFLAYPAGGHFAGPSGVRGHADDSIAVGGAWQRNDPLRHVVGIIWPNAHDPDAADSSTTTFSGGEIVFPFITVDGETPLTISPRAGDCVVFPASPPYLHYVKRVKAGLRLSVTTWWSFPDYGSSEAV